MIGALSAGDVVGSSRKTSNLDQLSLSHRPTTRRPSLASVRKLDRLVPHTCRLVGDVEIKKGYNFFSEPPYAVAEIVEAQHHSSQTAFRSK